MIRVAVLSRNLTFDRSWDIALASEATPGRRTASSGPLGRMISELAGLCTSPLPQELVERIAALSKEVARTAFPAPDGFSDTPIAFHALGLQRTRRWAPRLSNGRDIVAISPFVTSVALEMIHDLGWGKKRLIGRQEELDGISPKTLEQWDEVRVLTDSVSDELDEATSSRPSGLHAKIVVVEHGWDATWYVGSANLTTSALYGRNVEVIAAVSGRKVKVGISKFLSEFDELCETYRPSEQDPEENEDREAEDLLERAVEAVARADLRIRCRPTEDLWNWHLDGRIALPHGVAVRVWPVSVDEEHALWLDTPVSLALPTSRLTAFVAFELSINSAAVMNKRVVLKLPIEGVPAERTARILRSLIDSPERLLAFLRALLGGLEGFPDALEGDAAGTSLGSWQAGWDAETLLEDMLRAVSRDPARLETVRRLLADLRSTEESRDIIPEALYSVWQAVETTLKSTGRRT